MNLVEEVKKKKEFSELPDSVVLRALGESGEDVKEARKLLRKYFGVFLTNRVLRRGGSKLEFHISSKKRDYENFYREIFEVLGIWDLGLGSGDIKSVIDFGCGVNGFSYEFLPKGISYVGIEAAGQLVFQMNDFFEEKGFDGRAVCLDLFEVDEVVGILKETRKKRIGFLFQVVDALENMKRDFSKEFILEIMKELEILVISLPLVSLGGRKKIGEHKRKWLVDFLEENFKVVKDFEMFGERVLIVEKA